MTDKKQVFLSLETARQMWKSESKLNGSHDTSTKLFLLDNFTKEELEAKELPKTYSELGILSGYRIKEDCRISGLIQINHSYYTNRNIFPTKELAEASLALSQLLQLRDVYNGDWKIDLNNKPNEDIYIIINRYNNIETNCYNNGLNYILSFQKESIRDQFVKNFEDLITTALPLL